MFLSLKTSMSNANDEAHKLGGNATRRKRRNAYRCLIAIITAAVRVYISACDMNRNNKSNWDSSLERTCISNHRTFKYQSPLCWLCISVAAMRKTVLVLTKCTR
jgi:hypothetical protein